MKQVTVYARQSETARKLVAEGSVKTLKIGSCMEIDSDLELFSTGPVRSINTFADDGTTYVETTGGVYYIHER